MAKGRSEIFGSKKKKGGPPPPQTCTKKELQTIPTKVVSPKLKL